MAHSFVCTYVCICVSVCVHLREGGGAAWWCIHTYICFFYSSSIFSIFYIFLNVSYIYPYFIVLYIFFLYIAFSVHMFIEFTIVFYIFFLFVAFSVHLFIEISIVLYIFFLYIAFSEQVLVSYTICDIYIYTNTYTHTLALRREALSPGLFYFSLIQFFFKICKFIYICKGNFIS